MTRLSWNEIRARAATFAAEWQDAAYEKGETHSFYNDFFDIFGVKRRTVARYEEHVKRLDNSSGFIDLFWPGVLLVEQKSAGRDLTKAYGQASDYFDVLPEQDRPRYILVSDFQTSALHDWDERETASFALTDLPHHVEKFGFILGVQKRTFAWGSDARGKAHVHVVILGLDRRENMRTEKRLFSYPDLNGDPEETRHAALSPYLFDVSALSNPHTIVRDTNTPILERPRMMRGVQPTDGGHYIFSDQERNDFIDREPNAEKFFRPFIGAREHINGLSRWILFLEEAAPEELRTMPLVVERIRRVRAMRLASKKAATVKLADRPTQLEGRSIPTAPFLVIPEVSSERRDYVPTSWLEPPTIPSDLVFVLQNATLSDFALFTSAMHMAWLRHIGGRLKSDYRYSIGLVYNTFPTPPDDSDLSKLEPLAQAVLAARAAHPGATLADLYDPDLMPPNLRKAHTTLDRAVDRLYRRGGFASERERVEHLFGLYEEMMAPLVVKPKRRRERRPPPGRIR